MTPPTCTFITDTVPSVLTNTAGVGGQDMIGGPKTLATIKGGQGQGRGKCWFEVCTYGGSHTCTSNKATRHVQCKGKRGKSRVWHLFLATSAATAPEARGKGGQDRRRVLTLLRLHN